jgi:hypothetical protein
MPAGRPTLYKEEFNEQVEKLCKLGATDNEIADFFEVDVSSINNWKISHPEFFESIKKGKILADSNVADRLYQRALGFEHDGEEIKIADGEVIRVPIRKIYPPDATAAIFWLKNRRSKEWRDKQEVEQSGGITIKFENPTDYIYPSQDQSDSGIPESI